MKIDINQLSIDFMIGNLDPSFPSISKKGSLCIGDIDNFITLYYKNQSYQKNFKINTIYKSFFLMPLIIGDNRIGLLHLKSRKVNCFTKYAIEFYENFVQTLGLLLMGQRAQAALQERVKELTCLYGIAHAVKLTDFSLNDIMQSIVELLPPAWQYPKIAHSRITIDGKSYLDSDFKEGPHKQIANIVVNGEKCGTIEVLYEEKKTNFDEGPFLKEERSLIDSIAREVAIIIERKQAFEYKEKLNKQLRHADRLATIGQLAAGVAHELNKTACRRRLFMR